MSDFERADSARRCDAGGDRRARDSSGGKQRGVPAGKQAIPARPRASSRCLPITWGRLFYQCRVAGQSVEVETVDDCRLPVTTGRVAVSFSTRKLLELSHGGSGRWLGTWISRAKNQTNTRLTLRVETEAPRLTAQAELTVGIRQNTTQPVIEKGGIRSLATLGSDEPLASGSLAAILGSGLASVAIDADSLPLPVPLEDAGARGRTSMPLRKVAEGRVEAFLPQGLPEFTPLQMIVQRGQAYSAPESLVLVGVARRSSLWMGRDAIKE